ncbi:MAG: hypothetical protein ACJAWO_000428 [Halieaceae bacterium]
MLTNNSNLAEGRIYEVNSEFIAVAMSFYSVNSESASVETGPNKTMSDRGIDYRAGLDVF